MSEKSPISILQEHYVKRGIVPQYIEINEGTNTGPFTCKVEVDGLTAVGTGISKKQAKHYAANALLKLLKKDAGPNQAAEPTQPTVQPGVPASQIPVYNRPVRPNFVGKLHEYLIQRKSSPPKYEVVGEEGPAHMKQFTMRCILNDLKDEGTARSKQEAKNIAAEKVWEKLQCDGNTEDESTKPKRRKLATDSEFTEVLKEFRSVMDDLGGSFYFEEETAKEYAIDAAGNTDDLAKLDEKDRKMFSFLGTRSFNSLLPEKSSIILKIDTGVDSRTIGARGWTRRDAILKALSDGIAYLSKREDKHVQENGADKQPEVSEA